MKLIITGGSGFVASEVVRQSLKNPQISSVIVLARRLLSAPTDLGPGVDAEKFLPVQIDDYGIYSDEVKQQLAGADACIWTVAVTPTKSKSYTYKQLRKINHEDTLSGLQAIFEASKSRDQSKPFRFMYMSGFAAERDQTKSPSFMAEYGLLRGETETAVLDYAAATNGQLEACVAKPGLIKAPWDVRRYLMAGAIKLITGVPSLYNSEIAAAMIDQVLNGFEKEPLMNDDLARIGKKVLEQQ